MSNIRWSKWTTGHGEGQLLCWLHGLAYIKERGAVDMHLPSTPMLLQCKNRPWKAYIHVGCQNCSLHGSLATKRHY